MHAMPSAVVLAETRKLREMGARIQFVNAKLCYVRFQQDGIQIEYAYSINPSGKYHLERMKPYPLPLREFTHEEKLIEIIEIDLDQFRNAMAHDKNLMAFVDTCKEFHRVFQRFEDLYLYFDVSDETLADIRSRLDGIDAEIRGAISRHTRIYHRKEPDTLKD